MSTIATLEEIVGHSIKVENEVVRGDENAKKELQNCLPIERGQFEELAKDVSNDFMFGYDDLFPRVPMNVIKDATKKQNGEIVPAFAIYDVNGSGEYEITSATRTDVSSKSGLSRFAGKFETTFWHIAKRLNGISGNVVMPPTLFGVMSSALSIIFTATGFISSLDMSPGSSALYWMLPSFITTLVGFSVLYLGDDIKLEHIFTHKFSGVIPADIRKIIKDNDKKFSKIYLVEEGYAWGSKTDFSVTQKPSPRNIDPLIIGEIQNTKTGDMNYFLLAKFDVTPLENFIATELSA